MKLSKQERIGAFVIAIIVILALGIFLFIKPRFEAIQSTTATLESKQQELVAAVEKQNTKDPLRDQVLAAYRQGETLADMFFPELCNYDAEAEFRAFLEQCEANVLVESLSVSSPGTSTLTAAFYSESEVTYDLKSYVTQGLEPSDEELAAANRQFILSEALGSGQTVGSTTISFTVNAIDQEELLKFCDEVNSYVKDEHGTPTRKALMIGGISMDFADIQAEYDEIIEEIQERAASDATTALYRNAGLPVPAAQPNTTTPNTENPTDPNASNAQEQEVLVLEDNIYSLSTSITFYSVEHMQDPTEQLDQQDNTVIL
ncbi:MAG: hypothetical protein K2O14_06250 [Oscillospiraceae bacterium]|nr:hypothetical protein [Oscillospiraceae bacterium]